jgi:tmRNA-binding protein
VVCDAAQVSFKHDRVFIVSEQFKLTITNQDFSLLFHSNAMNVDSINGAKVLLHKLLIVNLSKKVHARQLALIDILLTRCLQ